jgi:hypothetical protein
MRFHVLTAANTKIALWDIVPCSRTGVYRRFRCACCLHNQGVLIALLLEAVSVSDASVNFYARGQRDRLLTLNKAVPLHVTEALGEREGIAPTHSRTRQ